MEKSTLIEILKTFSKDELANFSDFVSSPYHNKKSNVIKLYNILRKYAPGYDADKITKEAVWKLIFPGKIYNYGIMKNLIHDLTKLCENYLADITSKKNLYYDKNLIEELRRRNLISLHKKMLDKLNSKIDKLPKDENFYTDKIMIMQEHLYINIDKKLADNMKVESMNYNLKLFLLRRFVGVLNLFIEAQNTGVTYTDNNISLFLDFFNKNREIFENEEVLQIYYNLLSATLYPDDERYYVTTKNFFYKIFHTLDYSEKRNIYNMLMTICIQNMELNNRKDIDFPSEMSKLQREMIKFSLFSEEGTDQIDIQIYRNIIIWSLNIKDKELMNEFIQKYMNKVVTTASQTIEFYSKAHICFVNNDFNKCLEYCSKTVFTGLFESTREAIYFKRDIKSLEIRCLYELDLTESLINAVDSYKRFITSSDMMKDTTKENIINSIKLTKELILLKTNSDFLEIKSFKKRLLTYDKILFKNWLLEKIEELEK